MIHDELQSDEAWAADDDERHEDFIPGEWDDPIDDEDDDDDEAA